MSEDTVVRKDKFTIKVILAIFLHGKYCSCCFESLGDKIAFPQMYVEKGKGIYDTAITILNKCTFLDRTNPFQIELKFLLDEPQRYEGHYDNSITVVFKLDADEKSEVYPELRLLNAEDCGKYANDGKMFEDHKEVLERLVNGE